MMPCRESARLIRASLERKLRWKERIQLYLHLRACEICKRYQRQLRFIEKSLGRSSGLVDVDTPLPPKTRQRILQRIDDEAAQ